MIIDTIKVASNLTSAEKKLDYEAEATEYVPSHRFPKKGERPAMTCAALKSLCKNIRENTHECTVYVRTIVCTRVMCVYLIEHVHQREPSFGMLSAGDCRR